MPLVDKNGGTFFPPETQDLGASDPSLLGAAFRQTNITYNVLQNFRTNPVGEYDPLYDPSKDPQYAANPGIVELAPNREQARRAWEDYQQAQKDKQTLQEAGSVERFLATLAVTLPDFPTVAFGMLPAFSGGLFLQAAKSAGAFASISAGSEAALVASKGEKVTAPDVLYSAAAGGILGAAFPWAGFALRKGKEAFQGSMAKAHSDLVSTLKEVADTPATTLRDASDVGATTTAGDATTFVTGAGIPMPQGSESLIRGSAIKGLSKLSPANLIVSPVPQVRALAAHIGQFSGRLAGGHRVPQAVSTQLDMLIGKNTALMGETTPLWKGYKRDGGNLSFPDFNKEVGKAMHGIISPAEGTPLAKATKLYRDTSYDPLMKRAVDSGVLGLSDRKFSKAFSAYKKEQEAAYEAANKGSSAAPVRKVLPSEFFSLVEWAASNSVRVKSEAISGYVDFLAANGEAPRMLTLKGATQYGNTLYDKNALIQDGPGWDRVVGEYLQKAFNSDVRRQQKNLVKLEEAATRETGKLGSVSQDLTGKLDSAREKVRLAESNVEEAFLMAADMRASIVNNGAGVLPREYNFREYAGASLHERTLGIERKAISQWLNTDIRDMSAVYTRDLGSKVLLFDRFGTTDKKEVIAPIQSAWQKVIDAAPVKSRTSLQQKAGRDLSELSHIWDRVEGTAGWAANPNSRLTEAGVVLRAVGLLLKLGKLPISALNDIARPGMVLGQIPAAKMAARLVTDLNFARMSHDALVNAVGMSEIQGTRILEMAELATHGGLQHQWAKAINARVPEFIRLTGMAHANEWTKTWAGTLYLDEVAKAAVARKYDAVVFTDWGIEKHQVDNIRAMLQKYGRTHKGVSLPNTRAWRDSDVGRQAADVLDTATRKAVDEIIVTPGALDRWTFIDTEVGKTVFQFSSFNFASNNRAIIAGLTGHSAAFYTGVANMILIGAMSWAAKQYLAGRGDKVSKVLNDPKALAMVAVQNSGMGHVFSLMEMSMVTGGLYPQSRYVAADHQMGDLLGPGASTVKDVMVLLNSYTDGKLTARDAKAAVKLLPYYGLWQIQGLMSAFGINPNQLGK